MGIADAAASLMTSGVNVWQQQKQNDWQERMSNTAYQRAVVDMKKAGLNPAMMYSGAGGSASSPQGASPIPVENPLSSALANKNIREQLEMAHSKNEANIDYIKSQARKSNADARILEYQASHAKNMKDINDFIGPKGLAAAKVLSSPVGIAALAAILSRGGSFIPRALTASLLFGRYGTSAKDFTEGAYNKVHDYFFGAAKKGKAKGK